VIQARLLLCSDSASIDARLNTISAFHIAEEMNTPSFPVVIPRISLVLMLVREEADPSNVQLQLQIHSANQQVFAGPIPFDFAQRLAGRAIADMHGLLVPLPGLLRFVVLYEERQLGSWAITMNQIGQASLQMNLGVVPPVPPPQPL
jgi:hypothetical protein